MGPTSPGPAELIRASQRDNEFIKRLKQDIDEMILEVFGQRVWLRWQEYTQYGSSLIYYALTNFIGYQTLGEEYVGMIPIDASGKDVPSTKAMSLMIFTQVLGTPFLNYVIKMIENFNKRQIEAAVTFPKYLMQILTLVLRFGRLYQRFAPVLSQLHLALFYINGKFFQFSKRLSGIRYILVRHYFANEDAASKRSLKYLMWMSILNLAITTAHESYGYISEKMKRCYQLAPSLDQTHGNDEHRSSSVSDKEDVDSTKRCSLCLEARRHSSVTPCGHMFCWECIIDWLSTEGACPICRESVLPSRVIPLQNLL